MDHRSLTILIDNISAIMDERFRYHKFYYGEVQLAADLFLAGHVMVQCDQLGCTLPYEWLRVQPIGGPRSAIFPKRGDKGLIFFQDADPEWPKFLPLPPKDMVAKLPIQKKYTLLKTAVMGSSIDVDELIGGFTIESKSPLGMVASVEPTVLGTKLKELWDWQMDFNKVILQLLNSILGHVMEHIHQSPVGPTSPAMPPVVAKIAADKVKVSSEQVKVTAKKAAYMIPGQLLSPSNKMN